ncbi:MAG: metallophosphoesterase [Paracoccaceae bacterium]
MTRPIYAIGDIHGQLGQLDTALTRIEADGGAEATVVFLGDFCDRGADSRGVIDRLIEGRDQGRDWVFLKGNHDRMFRLFMADYPQNDDRLLVGYHWLHERIGGLATLASYGVEVAAGARIYQVHAAARAAVPPEHIAFLDGLRPFHQAGGLLFVHAGIRPGVPLAEQHEDDLIWIREEFLLDPVAHPWLVVHGHTHVDTAEHRGNRVNLDTGAGYGAPLSTAVFDADGVFLLTPDGRVPLVKHG